MAIISAKEVDAEVDAVVDGIEEEAVADDVDAVEVVDVEVDDSGNIFVGDPIAAPFYVPNKRNKEEKLGTVLSHSTSMIFVGISCSQYTEIQTASKRDYARKRQQQKDIYAVWYIVSYTLDFIHNLCAYTEVYIVSALLNSSIMLFLL